MNGNRMLAERLLLSRRQAGFKQKELARRANISNSYISDIENKRITNVGVEIIEALAKALEISPTWLAGWGDDSLLSLEQEEREELDEETRRLVEILKQLDRDRKETLLHIANLLAKYEPKSYQ